MKRFVKVALPATIAAQTDFDFIDQEADGSDYLIGLWRGSERVEVRLTRSMVDNFDFDLWAFLRQQAESRWLRIRSERDRDDAQTPSPL